MQARFHAPTRILIGIIVYFVAMYLFLGVLLLAGGVDLTRTSYGFLSTMNLLVGPFLIGAILLAYRWMHRERPLRLGFGFRKKDASFVATAMLVTLIVALAFAWFYADTKVTSAQFHFDKMADPAFLLLLLYGWAGWLLSVLQEEVMNRGFVMANMFRMGTVGMILASSVLFSLTHIPTKGFHPVQLAVHLIGGIGYAYMYLKSGSLWVSAAAHGTHNLAMDLLFNDDYSVSLVSFGNALTDTDKLLQQIVITAVIMVITHLFYGKNGVLTPASNLKTLWFKGEH